MSILAWIIAAASCLAILVALFLLRLRRAKQNGQGVLDRVVNLGHRLHEQLSEQRSESDQEGIHVTKQILCALRESEDQPGSPASSEPISVVSSIDPVQESAVDLSNQISQLDAEQAVQTDNQSLNVASLAVVYIRSHVYETVRVEKIAEGLGVSKSKLYAHLRECMGCSAHELITVIKMQEAKRLLTAEDLLVKEVALRLGYSSPYHFSYRFKIFFGVAPDQLKKHYEQRRQNQKALNSSKGLEATRAIHQQDDPAQYQREEGKRKIPANVEVLQAGTAIDRFLIVEPIGYGGMGVVYKAYDPKLDRGVALKLIRTERAQSAQSQNRLLREAQALARLSHPNVLHVYDVGTFDKQVYMTMALVEGQTLRDWLKIPNHSIKDVLQVMTQAGRGLSAAHKAGLVHRDFKPSNVIVANDGQVRVLDFGLARAVSSQEEKEGGHGQPQESDSSQDFYENSSGDSVNLLMTPLTLAGKTLGTPLYMAPEQHLGQETDARTDQFGFCIVLYEALYGRQPFTARSLQELKNEVTQEKVSAPRADTGVPAWLWQIVRKGLSANPKDRYSSIDSLLAELEKDPEEVRSQKQMARWRRFLVTSMIVMIFVVPIGTWFGLRYRKVQLCRDARQEFAGVWDGATKAKVKKSFLGTKKPVARDAWTRVEGYFDSYRSAWVQMRSDICEARWIRGTQSEELFDLRMSCLKSRKLELEALVKVLMQTDEEVIQEAVQASASLTRIKICEDEKALRAFYTPPETTEMKTKVSAIRERLSEVEAFSKIGKYREALELANKLNKEVDDLDYLPVQAEVLFWIGDMLYRTGKYKKSANTLDAAARLAGESRHLLIAVKAMISLVWVVGYKQARHQDGLLIARDVEILLGITGRDEFLRSQLYNNLGAVFVEQGNFDKALQHHQKALAIREKMFEPEHLNVAQSLFNLGTVLYHKGDYDKALQYYRKVVGIYKKKLAPEHPNVAKVLYNIGTVLVKQGQYNQALASFRQAATVWEKAVGPDHPHLAGLFDNMGHVFMELGEYQKATQFHQKAAAIYEQSFGAEHSMRAFPINSMGHVFLAQAQYKKALSFFEKAFEIWEKSLGRDHNYTALALIGYGQVFLEHRKYNKALEYFREALDVWEKKLGTESPQLADALQGLGFALLGQGNAHASRERFERLAHICQNRICGPYFYARGLFGLAQALVATGSNTQRLLLLAKQALGIFGKMEKRYHNEIQEVVDWLQKYQN